MVKFKKNLNNFLKKLVFKYQKAPNTQNHTDLSLFPKYWPNLKVKGASLELY